MEVYFTPEVQAQQERRTSETRRPADELLQDALAGYFDELTATREMLNSRYDDLKSGRVKPVSSVEVRARRRQEVRPGAPIGSCRFLHLNNLSPIDAMEG
jgi:hypothetical protein